MLFLIHTNASALQLQAQNERIIVDDSQARFILEGQHLCADIKDTDMAQDLTARGGLSATPSG